MITGRYTKVIISRLKEGPNCSVCVGEGSSEDCNTQTITINEAQTTRVNFTCSRPQDIFTINISRNFGKRQQKSLLVGSCFLFHSVSFIIACAYATAVRYGPVLCTEISIYSVRRTDIYGKWVESSS